MLFIDMQYRTSNPLSYYWLNPCSMFFKFIITTRFATITTIWIYSHRSPSCRL